MRDDSQQKLYLVPPPFSPGACEYGRAVCEVVLAFLPISALYIPVLQGKQCPLQAPVEHSLLSRAIHLEWGFSQILTKITHNAAHFREMATLNERNNHLSHILGIFQ